jgi:hypothetical protein
VPHRQHLPLLPGRIVGAQRLDHHVLVLQPGQGITVVDGNSIFALNHRNELTFLYINSMHRL